MQYKIEKSHLKNKEWANIFKSVGHDTELLSKFLKLARKDKKIEAADLDTVAEDISKYAKSHIEFSTSGIKFV